MVFKVNSEGKMPCSFLQNRGFGRGSLNNICIASYGVGAKFFTTNLMSVDLPQNTPKTRKPIAERTSHRWHGYTTRGAAVSAAPNNYSSHGMHGTHRTFLQRKDSHGWHGWTQIVRCAVLPQNSQNTQNWAAWVWQGCHTLLICEHLCSSVGGSSLPEGSVCAFCGNIFSPTDGTDGHRWLWCAVLPQNSQNTQNLAAWVWQGCHTLLHLCHLWESFLSKRFCEFRAFCGNIFSPTDFTDLHRCLECAVLQQNTEFGSVGMAGMPYPPNL